MDKKDPMTVKNVIFAILAVTLLFVLGFTVHRESNPEWKKYQKEFFRLMVEKTGNKEFANTPLTIRQIWQPSLGRTDRCMTCHIGIEQAAFADAPQPFTAHPDLNMQLQNHPFSKFGCTICHEGDGYATTVERTHGEVHHLEKLLLVGEDIQSSCTKCHFDIYKREVDLPGTEVLMKGMRRITKNRDCKRACHTIKQIGWKGTKAPNISNLGSKTELAFYLMHNFQNIKGEHTMANYLFEHFLDPDIIDPDYYKEEADIPGSEMPNLELSDEEAKALTIFVMSLKDPKVEKIPYEYIPISAIRYTIKDK